MLMRSSCSHAAHGRMMTAHKQRGNKSSRCSRISRSNTMPIRVSSCHALCLGHGWRGSANSRPNYETVDSRNFASQPQTARGNLPASGGINRRFGLNGMPPDGRCLAGEPLLCRIQDDGDASGQLKPRSALWPRISGELLSYPDNECKSISSAPQVKQTFLVNLGRLEWIGSKQIH